MNQVRIPNIQPLILSFSISPNERLIVLRILNYQFLSSNHWRISLMNENHRFNSSLNSLLLQYNFKLTGKLNYIG